MQSSMEEKRQIEFLNSSNNKSNDKIALKQIHKHSGAVFSS